MPYIFPKSRNASSRDILRTTRASTMNRRSVDSISGTTSLVASIERATGSYSSGVADGTRLLSIESRAAASASSSSAGGWSGSSRGVGGAPEFETEVLIVSSTVTTAPEPLPFAFLPFRLWRFHFNLPESFLLPVAWLRYGTSSGTLAWHGLERWFRPGEVTNSGVRLR